MTVSGHTGGGGGLLAGKQLFPVDYEAELSQRLLEASHSNDLKTALECIADPSVDVNYVGAVSLKFRKAELVLCGESPHRVRVVYEEFKTELTALFLAVHTGNVVLVRKLLSTGADVNQKLFRGFATTAAVREGHQEILEILLKAGASQPACEEALLEASCLGLARLVELLMGSDLIQPHAAINALVTACCRGFVDVVEILMRCGVDLNATTRVLLQSLKPSLHTIVDCSALVAAIVSRQVSVVRLLLLAGAKTDIGVRLGAWSWDTASGEEIRVGAGLSEPYTILWCAVEYFEGSGAILQMLLQHISINPYHYGRTILHHAILCGNSKAVKVLLNCGADLEAAVKTTHKVDFRPIHIAARLGFAAIVQCLIDSGCDLNTVTGTSETALMICARYRQEECMRVLARAGADFALVSTAGQTASSIARSSCWYVGFQQAVLDTIANGKVIKSSNISVFSPLLFVAQSGDVQALNALMGHGDIDLDYQDDQGLSAVMVTAMEGHVEAFRLLVYAGADVKLSNKCGETAITLSRLNQKFDQFEKVMIEFAIEKGNCNVKGIYALHYAARRGDLDAVKLLISRGGYDVNISDGDGYTPLMLAAREGHGSLCKLLISHGAKCNVKNVKGETALSLARNNGGTQNDAECVILDEIARSVVSSGACVWKHTKGGKGAPHKKSIRMLVNERVLRWGSSSRRNVICREAELGPSSSFQQCRQGKGDANEPGVFRVVTTENKEIHFMCDGGSERAHLWVRGIKLVSRAAMSEEKHIEE